jgi:DMSO/TMAO reductase YedYZ molybdopterin-dependent catalytic subunit
MADDHPTSDVEDVKTESPPAAATSSAWTLTIAGAVADSRSLGRADIRELVDDAENPDRTIVDDWNGDGHRWRGARIDELLARADPDSDAAYALVHAMDGDYSCSFPLDRLGDALLAIQLDGEPIPPERGGPARLLVVDERADCWESMKWVSRIDVRTENPASEATSEPLAQAHDD